MPGQQRGIERCMKCTKKKTLHLQLWCTTGPSLQKNKSILRFAHNLIAYGASKENQRHCLLEYDKIGQQGGWVLNNTPTAQVH